MENEEALRDIFGEGFFGTKEIKDVFGKDSLKDELVSKPCLSIEQMRLLKDEGYDLIYIPRTLFGERITAEKIVHLLNKVHPNICLLFDIDDIHKWYRADKNSFFYKEETKQGWYCFKSRGLKDCYFSIYQKQEEKLNHYTKEINKVMNGSRFIFNILPVFVKKMYKKERCVYLTIERSSLIQELFRLVLSVTLSRHVALHNEYVWTNTKEGKEYVRIGRFDTDGADITKRDIYDGNSMTTLTPVIKVS
jgi:hypothetical protein